MEVRGQPGRWDIAWQARRRGQEAAPQLLASPILGVASQLQPHVTGTPGSARGVSSPELDRGRPGREPAPPRPAWLSALSPHTPLLRTRSQKLRVF